MDHHPRRNKGARLATDPEAYRQGYDDAYTRCNAGRAVHTSNTASYQAGYLDGGAERLVSEAETGLHSEARGQADRAV